MTTSVGYVVLDVTESSFKAVIHLQNGSPQATYMVFMQQEPGSCPQPAANAGSLTTNSAGEAVASTSVGRVSSARVFFVQLVPTGSGSTEYTSDRITVEPE